jgi:hypothetical protein
MSSSGRPRKNNGQFKKKGPKGSKKEKKDTGAILETEPREEKKAVDRRHVQQVPYVAVPDEDVGPFIQGNKHANAIVKTETRPSRLEKQLAFAEMFLPLGTKPRRILTIHTGYTGAAVASRIGEVVVSCFTPSQFKPEEVDKSAKAAAGGPDHPSYRNFIDIQAALVKNAHGNNHVHYIPGQSWESDAKWKEFIAGDAEAWRTITGSNAKHWEGGADIVQFNLDPRLKGRQLFDQLDRLLKRIPTGEERKGRDRRDHHPVVFIKVHETQTVTKKDDDAFERYVKAKREDGQPLDVEKMRYQFSSLTTRHLLRDFVENHNGWHAAVCTSESGFAPMADRDSTRAKFSQYIALFYEDRDNVARNKVKLAVERFAEWKPKLFPEPSDAKHPYAFPIGNKRSVWYSGLLAKTGFSEDLGIQKNANRIMTSTAKKQASNKKPKGRRRPRKGSKNKAAAAAAAANGPDESVGVKGFKHEISVNAD